MEVNIKTGTLVSMVMRKPAVSVFNVEKNPEARYSKFLQTVVPSTKPHGIISQKAAIITAQNIITYSDHIQGIQLYSYLSSTTV
jgi:hypothetical protein